MAFPKWKFHDEAILDTINRIQKVCGYLKENGETTITLGGNELYDILR